MEIDKTEHKLNKMLDGLIDTIFRPRCPVCKHELSRVHDSNPQYQATFCRTCYDWVPLHDELTIDVDQTKPCPKCGEPMFCIEEIWEEWYFTPHRWGCMCGYETPYK